VPAYISDIYNGNDAVSTADDTIINNIVLKINGVPTSITSINSQVLTSTVPSLYLLSYNSTTLSYFINIAISSNLPSYPINVTLTLANITNPNDNRVMQFKIYQH